MIEFEFLHQDMTPEHLGIIPYFFSEQDQRPAAEQVDAAYISGWNPMPGFKLNTADLSIKYPGDPALKPIAKAKLHDETLYFYDYAWLLILQPNGEYAIARLD